MGSKRKHREDEEARISKKIKKLERKLQRRKRIISSDESESETERQVLPTQSTLRTSSPPVLPYDSPCCHEEILEVPSLRVAERSLCEPSISIPGPSSDPTPSATNENADQEEENLDEDILQILGEAPQPDIALGKNVHKDIAARWQDILSKGLPKEVKETILKKYLIPANCNLLVAPLLNLEAKAAVSDILIKRDISLSQKQNQIGIALAALSQVTEMILHNDSSKQKLLQPLSDACRILCDSHYVETKTRRSIITSSINTSLRDALTNANRDKYLFGEDIAEKLRVAKTVQKTGESLVKSNPAVANKGSNYKNLPKNRNLNFRGPIQRKPPIKTAESSRGRPQAHQTRSLTTYARPPPGPPTATKRYSPTRRNYRR